MNKTRVLLLSFIAILCQAVHVMAQNEPKEIVVVMKTNYTYEDPRWGQPVTLEKGHAITVWSDGLISVWRLPDPSHYGTGPSPVPG